MRDEDARRGKEQRRVMEPLLQLGPEVVVRAVGWGERLEDRGFTGFDIYLRWSWIALGPARKLDGRV